MKTKTSTKFTVRSKKLSFITVLLLPPRESKQRSTISFPTNFINHYHSHIENVNILQSWQDTCLPVAIFWVCYLCREHDLPPSAFCHGPKALITLPSARSPLLIYTPATDVEVLIVRRPSHLPVPSDHPPLPLVLKQVKQHLKQYIMGSEDISLRKLKLLRPLSQEKNMLKFKALMELTVVKSYTSVLL